MPDLNRRTLLAGAAATGAFAATAFVSANDIVDTAPDLSGKSIFITGCSSGFGRLSAEHFARLGARVFATMRNLPRPEGDELKALAKREKLDLHVFELDVLSQHSIDLAYENALNANDQLPPDVLINNAGIGITSPVELQDRIATELMFQTNVFGPHRIVRTMLPDMRKRGLGQILQVSSQLGRVIVPYTGHYSATKFALEAMSEQLAYELVPHNIDVTIIEPGGYPTKVWENRNIYSAALKQRAPDWHKEGYPQAVARMGQEDGSGRSADPMDVPHEMAKLIASPAGTRPLRVAVHPGRKPQIPINELTAKVQTEWLGNSGYGPLIKGVHLR